MSLPLPPQFARDTNDPLAPHQIVRWFAVAFLAVCWAVSFASTPLANLAVVAAFVGWRARRRRAGALLAGAACAGFTIWANSPATTVFAHTVGESRIVGELGATVSSGPLPYPGGRYGYRVELETFDGRNISGKAHLVGSERMLPGDRFVAWTRLERPPKAAFPGDHGIRSRSARTGVLLTGSIREPPRIVGRRFNPWRPFARMKAAHIEGLLGALEDGRAAHAIALTTGHKAFISDEANELWSVSGTGHLLAISGLHFGLIALAAWSFGRWFAGSFPIVVRRWGARRAAAPLVALVLIVALLWVGGPTSARRAFVLAICAAVALGLLRRVTPSQLLAVSAVAVAANDPSVVHTLGYQLSFCATGAIVAVLEGPLAPKPWEDAPGFWRRVWHFVVVSTVASLGTAPALGLHLGAIPVGGFWANLWAIPAVASVVFPLTVLGSFAAAIWPDFGYTVVDVSMRMLDGLAWTIEHTAGIDTLWVTGTWPRAAAFTGLVAVAVLCATRRLRVRLLALLVVAGTAGWVEASRAPPDHLEVHAIPVGQGDATLVRYPDGTNMLIDAGGATHGRDPGSRVVVPYLRRVGVRRIDHLVVTHPDHDHIGGLAAVARGVELGAVIRDGCVHDDRVVEAVGHSPAPHVTTCSGLTFGDAWRTTITRPVVASDAKNERSLIVEVENDFARVLMTGDAEVEGEAWWVSARGRRATLLKLGHHGSKTSTNPGLLQTTEPALAFVSAGRFNKFGHPATEVVERVRGRGVPIASTARDGLVVYELDEKGVVRWRSVRAPPLDVQASTMRRTQSTGRSSRSGVTAPTPKSLSTDSTNR